MGWEGRGGEGRDNKVDGDAKPRPSPPKLTDYLSPMMSDHPSLRLPERSPRQDVVKEEEAAGQLHHKEAEAGAKGRTLQDPRVSQHDLCA